MRVLYVATDLRDADVLQQEVRRAAPKLVLDVCAGVAEARTRTERSLSYDVMLLDASLTEAEQIALIQHVRTKQIPLPIALLASQTTAASSTLLSAADECITRGPRLAERLAPGLRMAIERYRIVATTLRDNERLKRSEARLRLIIEALPAGVVLVDQAGRILAMNLAGAGLVGTSGPSDVVGREIYSLADAAGAQGLRDLVTRALNGERGRVEFECHGPDGALRRLSIEALCIQRDEAQGQGSVLGVLSAAASADAAPAEGIEFAFGGDLEAMADERVALDQALETMRTNIERLEHETATERGRVQQLLAELERARATAAEHHAHRTALDEKSRQTAARLEELEAQSRDEQAAMEAVVTRAGSLNDEAAGLRQERQRLAHESDALKQELLEQRRARLELEERVAAADVERERLSAVLATAQAAAETRIGQLDEELRSLKAGMGQITTRERALAAELDATKFEASRLGDDLAREVDARTRFEGELEQVRAELRAAMGGREADQASTSARLAEAQALMDAARSAEEGLRAELDAAYQREQAVRADLDAALAREQGLRGDADTQWQTRQDLEARLAQAGSQIGELEQAAGDAASREAAVQSDLAAAIAVRGDLEGQLAGASARVQQLETATAEQASQLEAISGELAASQFEATQLRDDLTRETETRATLEADLEARIGDLGSVRASADADRDVFQARIVELENDAASARGREEELSNRLLRLSDLETSMAEIEARRQAAVARIAELEERRRDEQTALAAAAQREADLAQELLTARDETARLAAERGDVTEELARERDRRRAIEDELTVRSADLTRGHAELEAQLAARDAELATLREEAAAHAESLREARESAARLESDGRAQTVRLEAELAQAFARLEDVEDREAALGAELQSLQQERDARGRQAFELETVLARERDERIDLQSRLQVLEREAADAGARSDSRLTDMQRDHQEVVARLQKLLEQSAAREFQAAALTTPRAGDRIRRRPAEKIGQLAAAMANDLNATIADVAEDARRLLTELPDGTTSRARAEQTLQTATRAGQLVRHLLRLSERESRMVSRVEVSALVRSNETLLRQLAGADIDLRFELAAGLAHVECDAEEVVQVLSTFVVTLRGSLPLGGVLRIGTQERARPEGRRRGDSALLLSVSAEGYGMVPVPTAGCEEVVGRIGGVFSSLTDQNQAVTSLQASLPIEARSNTDAAPGWSQTA